MKLDLVRRLGFRDESVEATKIVLAIVAEHLVRVNDTTPLSKWGRKRVLCLTGPKRSNMPCSVLFTPLREKRVPLEVHL